MLICCVWCDCTWRLFGQEEGDTVEACFEERYTEVHRVSFGGYKNSQMCWTIAKPRGRGPSIVWMEPPQSSEEGQMGDILASAMTPRALPCYVCVSSTCAQASLLCGAIFFHALHKDGVHRLQTGPLATCFKHTHTHTQIAFVCTHEHFIQYHNNHRVELAPLTHGNTHTHTLIIKENTTDTLETL